MREGTCPRCRAVLRIDESEARLFGRLQCTSCRAFLEIVDPFRLEIRTCGRSGSSWLCDWIHSNQHSAPTASEEGGLRAESHKSLTS